MTDVTIVVTTYYPDTLGGNFRRHSFIGTMQTWKHFILYNEGSLHIHIADDGTPNFNEFVESVWNEWSSKENTRLSITTQQRHGVGASLNVGIQKAFDYKSNIILYMVDDWYLTQPLDIAPWVYLLEQRKDVGMVRLGPPHPNNRGTITPYTNDWQGWVMKLDRYGFAFAHRPALYHKRMIDCYGWFKEDVNALACEEDYAMRFNTMTGPDIVLALPHPWQHKDTIELAYLDPTKENGDEH